MPGSRSQDSGAGDNSLFMTFLQHGSSNNNVPVSGRNLENFSTEETSRKNALLRKQLSKALEKASSEFPLIPPTN